MSYSGYYRFPTINRKHLVFVCEDDLWSYNLEDSSLSRLTSNYGAVSTPRLSPDVYVFFSIRQCLVCLEHDQVADTAPRKLGNITWKDLR